MLESHRYVMLLTSLPHTGPLFSARITPLSRLRLRERFTLLDPDDRQELEAFASVQEWKAYPARKTDEEIVQLAEAVIPGLRYPFSRELLTWRLEMRTVIAALRRRQHGMDIDAVGDEWGYGQWMFHIRKYWTEPCFRLEAVYPWIEDAERLLRRGEPVALERLLLEVVWNHLYRVEVGHAFDFESVLIYLSRWDLVARWTLANGELARARYEALLLEGVQSSGEPTGSVSALGEARIH